MSRKMTPQERRAREHKAAFEREKQEIELARQQSPALKAALQKLGCVLPFYEILDSYEAEFRKIAEEATNAIPSLLEIREVDNPTKSSAEVPFELTGYRQVFFEIDRRFEAYGTQAKKAAMTGSTIFLMNAAGMPASLIEIPRSINSSFRHPENKYRLKIGTLLHEVGHAWDVENKINIDPKGGRFDLVSAEAFANCYALDRLADRGMHMAYSFMYDAIAAEVDCNDFRGEIARLVLANHSKRTIVDWGEMFDEAMKLIERPSNSLRRPSILSS